MATGERPSNLRLLRTFVILDQCDACATRHEDSLRPCTYNARTVSTDTDLHALFRAGERIKIDVTALRETDSRKERPRTGDRQYAAISGEETPSRNIGAIGFAMHPSVVHLANSHKILLPYLTIFHLRSLRQKRIRIVKCYSPT
ncbi:hypothetical protein RB195_006619 [Necator americanus]|uniref:Uncharacterized protein n=1 Tax=Necator americanus TaxID=51031 RepID=A0ABR1BW78_NECAM